jgi:two-component system cell cycle sensor histidine kinase/response regulator CckA
VVTQSLEAIRVLLVEDDEDDYLITRDMLAQPPDDAGGAGSGEAGCRAGAKPARARFTVDWRSRYDESLQAIHEGAHDVYLRGVRIGRRPAPR